MRYVFMLKANILYRMIANIKVSNGRQEISKRFSNEYFQLSQGLIFLFVSVS